MAPDYKKSFCNDEKTPLIEMPPAQERSIEVNCNTGGNYQFQLQTLLSVIDEDPNEDLYVDLDSNCEMFLRRNSIHAELKKSWKTGLILAIVSGLLFTANNFLIQFFQVEALEILLVRSGFQALILGLIVSASPYSRAMSEAASRTTWRTRLYISLQAAFGAIRLYLNFACLEFLPLGDALTIIFTEPLFTVVLSFVLLRISVSLMKIMLCIGLLCGMLLSVQPPFLFSKANGEQSNDFYFNGVLMAMGCAICGSLCNILINKCDQVRSTVLVFYAGIGGVIVSVLGCVVKADTNRIITNLELLKIHEWLVLALISLVGILAYFAMTAALKMVSPTSVSVLRALEIVVAYLCQIVVMHQMPNTTCMFGAGLVILSVIGIAIEEKSGNRRTSDGNAFLPITMQIGRTFVVNPSI